jgi:peroxiredoxin
MKKNCIVIFFASLITIITILNYLSVNKQNKNNSYSDKTYEFEGLTIQNRKISSEKITSDYILLIFIEPNGCPNCLGEIYYWNKLASISTNILNVIGIVRNNSVNANTKEYFFENEEIKFPIIIDKKGDMFNTYSVTTGIMKKILINRRDKRISLVDYVYSDKYYQSKSYEKILKIMGIDLNGISSNER